MAMMMRMGRRLGLRVRISVGLAESGVLLLLLLLRTQLYERWR